MIKIFLLTILYVIYSYGADYKALQEYKDNYKSRVNSLQFRSVENNSKYKNYLQIIYFDINKMDTDILEKKYQLHLWQCIADGVCIFKYEGLKNIEQVIEMIKKEQKEIKSVKKYGQFQFIPF